MIDYPGTELSGILGFLFAQRLCEHLERNNALPAGEGRRIWAALCVELQNDHRALAKKGATALAELKLT